MITVHAYKTWQGETRVCIAHSAGSMPSERHVPGAAGVRSTLLNEVEARDLLNQLTDQLAQPEERDPINCIDCGSTVHRTGSVFCGVANQEEADAD